MMRSLLAIILLATCTTRTLAQQKADLKRYRVAELSNHAADLIDREQFAEAEHVLAQALEIDPDDLTSLYDLVCAIAGEGDAPRALAMLHRANRAGFSDFIRVANNPILANLRELPGYKRAFEPSDAAIHIAAKFQVKQLKSLLGDEYSVTADEPNRLIYAVRERSTQLADVQRTTRSLMASECSTLFQNRPQQFIRIIVASQVDYARLESRPGVRGLYDDATRTLLVRPGDAELRHEFTHALHAADQHARGQKHPVWLIEGFGVAFENGAAPTDNWRLANVQAASKSNSQIPLAALTAQSRAEFSQRSDLAYGEAGSLIVYLQDRGLLERFYKMFVADFPNDPTGRHALEASTSMSLAEIESDWRDWMTHRTAPHVTR